MDYLDPDEINYFPHEEENEEIPKIETETPIKRNFKETTIKEFGIFPPEFIQLILIGLREIAFSDEIIDKSKITKREKTKLNNYQKHLLFNCIRGHEIPFNEKDYKEEIKTIKSEKEEILKCETCGNDYLEYVGDNFICLNPNCSKYGILQSLPPEGYSFQQSHRISGSAKEADNSNTQKVRKLLNDHQIGYPDENAILYNPQAKDIKESLKRMFNANPSYFWENIDDILSSALGVKNVKTKKSIKKEYEILYNSITLEDQINRIIKPSDVEELSKLKNKMQNSGYPDFQKDSFYGYFSIEQYAAMLKCLGITEDVDGKPINESLGQVNQNKVNKLFKAMKTLKFNCSK